MKSGRSSVASWPPAARAILVAFGLLCGATSAQAQTLNMSVDLVRLGIVSRNLTPNDPTLDARPLFQAAVAYVHTHDVRLLTLDRGSYYFLTTQYPGTYLVFEDLVNVTIDLAGSTIYFADMHQTGLTLFYCQRVTLTNFTTDYLVAPYTHTRLSSVDPVNRRLHYTPINGWPDPIMFAAEPSAAEKSTVVAFVFRDNQILPGSTRMAVQALSTGTVELLQNSPFTEGSALSAFRPGDTLVVTFRGGGSPILIWHSDEVAVSNGRILGAANWALNMQRSSNSTIDGVRVEPRPGGLIGSTADGIHVFEGYRNNHIRNCHVTRTVDDALVVDALAMATVVAQTGPRSLQVRRTVYSRFPNGSLMNFVDLPRAAEIPGGVIVSQNPPDGRSPEFNGLVDLTFDRDLPALTAGSPMAFGDASMRGAGSTIEDNVVEDIPFGRGIWISGAVGTAVRRNVIRTTSNAGVAVVQMTPTDPAPPMRDLTIESNVLEGNLGPAGSGNLTQMSIAAVIVESLGAQFRWVSGALNTNVVVRDNYIVDSGQGGIWMGEVSGGRVENNFVSRWYQRPHEPIIGIPPDLREQAIQDLSQPIVLRHSAGVAVVNNDARLFSSITAPVSFSAPLVVMPSSAGTSSVGIAPVVSGFLWRAATQDAWIALTSPDGVGAGTLSFTVAPNTGPARTGHIRVAGQLLTVMQASAASSDTPGWIALAPPIVSGDSVTLNWSLPVGGQPATSFTIVASLSPGGPPVASLPVGAVQGLTVPAPAGVYYVRVVGVNAAGAGPMSNEVVVVVGDGSLPAAPQNLTAAVTGNLFRIAWRAAINVATAPIQSYVIEAGSGPGLSDLANFATGSPETQFVTPPVPNGSYFVRLRARNRLGTGPPSGEIRVIVGPPPPNAPVLSGSVGAGGSVTLSWTAPTTGAAVIGYQLQAGTTPGSSNAAVLNLLPLQRSFATAGVPQGTYYVRVVAMSAQGPSGASNELTLSVP